MQENSKNMHVVTDDLYFIIDEKLNSVEMTEKGIRAGEKFGFSEIMC